MPCNSLLLAIADWGKEGVSNGCFMPSPPVQLYEGEGNEGRWFKHSKVQVLLVTSPSSALQATTQSKKCTWHSKMHKKCERESTLALSVVGGHNSLAGLFVPTYCHFWKKKMQISEISKMLQM